MSRHLVYGLGIAVSLVAFSWAGAAQESDPIARLSDILYQEMTCSANKTGPALDQATEKKVKELAEGFADTWAKMAAIGLRTPSDNERHHFYSQLLHESMRFKYMTELGDGSKFVQGRPKYKGRGPIQVTHCYNYAGCARFVERLKTGEPARRLFEVVQSERKKCPPPRDDVKDHPIITDPEKLLGDAAPDKRLAATCTLYWWENAKFHMHEFRKSLTSGSEGIVEVSRTINGKQIKGLESRTKMYNKIGGCLNGNFEQAIASVKAKSRASSVGVASQPSDGIR